jgi:hypothetical protein
MQLPQLHDSTSRLDTSTPLKFPIQAEQSELESPNMAAQLSTPTSNAPLTPSDEPSPMQVTAAEPPQSQPVVDFSPATVPYNQTFENDLMNLILHPPENPSHPSPLRETPMIPASQLPVPLNSPQRTHPSPIPGLYLTHKNGYHTGGPGPALEIIRDFEEKLCAEHGIMNGDREEVKLQAQRLIQEKIEEVKERMEEREKAVKKNREVDEELEKLRLQRDAEVRVLERLKGKR